MSDQLVHYKAATTPLPDHYQLWPLYGTGFDNLGHHGAPLDVPLPSPGPDELLVRHDAVGICFSDIKVIRNGENHPRIHRDMRQKPVVLGHEVSLTIVGVGTNLLDQYATGDRFIVQADIYINGVSHAYGYEIQGGCSQYSIVDQRVLRGDGGNYLVTVRPTTGYAEAALTEPWACVEASYTVCYRTTWRPAGTVWLVGDGAGIDLGRARGWQPARLHLDLTDSRFAALVRTWARDAGIEVFAGPPSDDTAVDDVVVLSAEPELIERTFARLAKGGVFNVVTSAPVPRRVQLDLGRMHYDHLAVIGTASVDLSAAYTPIRTELKPGGSLWVLGAAGPMGHMHVQRALEGTSRPAKLVATNRHPARLRALAEKFGSGAAALGVELISLSHDDSAALGDDLRAQTAGCGFDDIAVTAPSAPAIEDALDHLADHGVMNVFAGVPRGTPAHVDLNAMVRRGVRVTGTSGSSIDDLRRTRDLTESNALSPNKAVAAVVGLEAVPDALRAVADGRFAGKVIIFPNLRRPLPLTPLAELHATLPTVAAKLDIGDWTIAAEEELLRVLL